MTELEKFQDRDGDCVKWQLTHFKKWKWTNHLVPVLSREDFLKACIEEGVDKQSCEEFFDNPTKQKDVSDKFCEKLFNAQRKDKATANGEDTSLEDEIADEAT